MFFFENIHLLAEWLFHQFAQQQDHSEKINWSGGKVILLDEVCLGVFTARKTHPMNWLCKLGISSFIFLQVISLKNSSTFQKCCISKTADLLWEGLSECISALQGNIPSLLLFEKWLYVFYSFKCMCLPVLFYLLCTRLFSGWWSRFVK